MHACPTIAFDRFYRYAELTELLQAFAREHPELVSRRIDRQEPRGPRHLGGDRHQRRDRPRGRQARVLGRRQHPRDRGRRVGREPLFPAHAGDAIRHATPTSRARSTRARSTSARASIPTAPNGRSPTSRSGSARARGRIRTARRTSKASPSRTSTATGASCRCASPIPTACGRRIPDEPRLMIRRDPAETGGTYYRIVPEGTVEDYDGFTLRIKKPVQGLDLNRNFPAIVAAGVRAARRRSVSRRRSRKCARSSTSSRAIRNITGGISFHTWSGVLLRPFEHQPDDEMHAEDLWVYQARGRQGHRAHRLSEHLGLSRVPLSPEVGDRRHVRLGLRAPRHVQLGRRDLVADARSGHRRLQVHRLVPRPSARGRPQAAALERREARRASRTFRGSRSTIRSSARSRSAAGTASTRSPIRRRSSSSASSRAFRSGSSGRRSISPKLELVHARRDARRRRQLRGRARRAEHGLAAVVRVASARWSARSCAASSPRSSCRRARRSSQGKRRDGARPARRHARTSTPAFRSGPTTTSPTTA